MLKNIKIGSDPELFIVNSKTEKIVSSIGLIPGEKGDAFVPKGFPKGFGLQIDNILAEFNIPPATNEEAFVKSMTRMKEYIREFVKEKNPDLDILCAASAEVDEDQLQSKEAKLFGCSPDYNAYTQCENKRPKGEKTNLRSCGMHIHIGYNNPNIDDSILIIKYMDLYLGLPSVILDTDTKRRELYGKAGCFRLCSYGCEYRVLSGFFLSSEELIRWVYKQTEKAINSFNRREILPHPELITKIINSGDSQKAIQLLEKYKINY